MGAACRSRAAPTSEPGHGGVVHANWLRRSRGPEAPVYLRVCCDGPGRREAPCSGHDGGCLTASCCSTVAGMASVFGIGGRLAVRLSITGGLLILVAVALVVVANVVRRLRRARVPAPMRTAVVVALMPAPASATRVRVAAATGRGSPRTTPDAASQLTRPLREHVTRTCGEAADGGLFVPCLLRRVPRPTGRRRGRAWPGRGRRRRGG